ncbi:kinase-like domain-containing protein [Rhizophagus irregularis DAOM 181602=DAOM 197198]|nr:kinase-like domain-containing protein [Rhizophagus irregularis DAOM 181602=DAOM 197198]CAB5189082.1 unnamed protein product [Rhizophagus irregularis]
MNKVEENYTSSRLFTSKIHNFGNLPEPRNATEEEQEDDEKEIIQHVDDDDEVYNNPNLHSEEQDELEIPDDGF